VHSPAVVALLIGGIVVIGGSHRFDPQVGGGSVLPPGDRRSEKRCLVGALCLRVEELDRLVVGAGNGAEIEQLEHSPGRRASS